ncbi:MAG: type II toxin-antitoxin system VapC family toxin [bacterium]
MTSDHLFMDTAFVVALLNPKDALHEKAKAQFDAVKEAREVWTTEAVLFEIGNAFGASRRLDAANFIERCFSTSNINVVSVSTTLFRRALTFYKQRPDKEWGLTDCASFVVMQEQNLIDALTHDIHFQQAGFRALLRDVTN